MVLTNQPEENAAVETNSNAENSDDIVQNNGIMLEEEEPEEKNLSEEGTTADDTVDIPEWFDTKKYGEFTPENVAAQARDYKNAVSAMGDSQRKAADLAKMVQKYEKIIEQVDLSKNNQKRELSEEDLEAQRTKLEEEYGIPFEQIKLQRDLLSMMLSQELAPLKEVIFTEKTENSLKEYLANPLYKDYEDEIRAELKKEPIESRHAKNTIENVLKTIIFRNRDNIFAKIKELAIGELNPGLPVNTPETVPAAGNKKQEVKKRVNLSPVELAYCKKYNINPEDVLNPKKDDSGYSKYLA
jgi:hypothetical protein